MGFHHSVCGHFDLLGGQKIRIPAKLIAKTEEKDGEGGETVHDLRRRG